MKKKISAIVSFSLLLSMVFFSGCGCKPQAPNYEVSLEVWGLFDDSDTMAKVISEYKKRNPVIKDIQYKKLTIDSYENDLRDALATGNGPDIFLIHNSWLTKHQDKLSPAPDSVITPKQVQDLFVDVVSQDFVKDSKIYALPLSVDSLALYFNKDLLNQAGFSAPPRTWAEFDEAVTRLTKVDSFGNIVQSGAAMGASSDASPGDGKINRATDILTAIMLQAGAQMYDPKTNLATFAEFTDASLAGKNPTSPGQDALAYYTKFSNRSNTGKGYSWNSTMHYSVDSFIEGQTAMTLNYSWLIPRIQSKAPKMNLGISTLPQNIVNGKGFNLNFANYWGYAVSKNKTAKTASASGSDGKTPATNEQRTGEAWNFIRYLTMPPAASQSLPKPPATKESADYDPAAEYAVTQKKPAARRDLVGAQRNDLLLAPFAEGNIIAKSWAQPDGNAVVEIFDNMIDNVTLKNADPQKAIENAEKSVNLLIKK